MNTGGGRPHTILWVRRNWHRLDTHCFAQVQPDQFWGAKPDPVAAFSGPVCGHMNADHGESTIAMIKHYVGITVSEARMLSLDRLGVNVECKREDSTFKVRLPFEEPAEDRKSIKDRIVTMTRTAGAAQQAKA